ncbi:MAG TPA: GNAT family N-acetyltransferase [Candidatus Aquilonibacter sp.]|nr:GNAT family N-acetyltransferase [Candidatus Aquilonibacter sp.]
MGAGTQASCVWHDDAASCDLSRSEGAGKGFVLRPGLSRIETPRLRLRGGLPEDVDAWARMNADPRVMEHFVATTPIERSHAQARLMHDDLERDGYGWFILELRNQLGFAGVIAIAGISWDAPFEPRREVGWRLPVERWGNGYATEGASAALRYAFDTLRWPEVVAMTATGNNRSQRVMQRLGMTRDPAEDFGHPRVPEGHRICRHVLYRLRATDMP